MKTNPGAANQPPFDRRLPMSVADNFGVSGSNNGRIARPSLIRNQLREIPEYDHETDVKMLPHEKGH
jgi:hypothetical protein